MVGEDFPATLLATVRYINGKEESVPILSDAKDE
jgi:hypothetical protein